MQIVCSKYINKIKFILLGVSLCSINCYAQAPFISDNKSTEDLEYGVVLFDYFQKNYFYALIEQEYAQAINNPIAKGSTGQILKGGMMLSYGMADASKKIFEDLLQEKSSEEISNKAWFYLAKMLYGKSNLANARDAISRVKGKVPDDIFTEYNYLVLLLAKQETQVQSAGGKLVAEDALKNAKKDTPYYPYLLFNMSILQLKNGQLKDAVANLEDVADYSGEVEEFRVLADRARHGLAELALKYNRLDEAWNYLNQIRTNGLYSNRALLAYAWTAINLKRYGDAIPALEMLGDRSIAIPEVQEAKVLLAHVYEQEGLLKKALQGNLTAEKDYYTGIAMIEEARRIIDKQDVPREFIKNLEAMMDDSDWYGEKPSVDYQKLTPFLVDLMAGHQFNEALKELADLYAIEENLTYWSLQADQHALILKNARGKKFDSSINDLIARSTVYKEELADRNSELKLYVMSLAEKEQERLNSLIENTNTELRLLDDKLDKLRQYDKPYQQPVGYEQMVADRHAQIKLRLAETRKYIRQFEVIMRGLVKEELNEHEQRMKFYAAQSKLAKARLYDLSLLSLEKQKANSNPKAVKK